MDCRTSARRQYIVKNYTVVPVAHIHLLAGQSKCSDAGATIKNEYYIFEAIKKDNGEKHIIKCGMGAAKDFLQLLNEHKGLPLFNPLHNSFEARSNVDEKEHQQGTTQNDDIKWNPVAEQLYNAIMWLIIAWDAKPGTPLFEIKARIEKHNNYKPYPSNIKGVNTIIKSGGKGKSLTRIIDNFRDRNEIRDEMCRFDLLTRIIEAETDEDGNKLISYF